MGHPNVWMGHPNVWMGHPNVLMGHPNVWMGHAELRMGRARANTEVSPLRCASVEMTTRGAELVGGGGGAEVGNCFGDGVFEGFYAVSGYGGDGEEGEFLAFGEGGELFGLGRVRRVDLGGY